MFEVKPPTYKGDQLLEPGILENKKPPSGDFFGISDTYDKDITHFEMFHPTPRLVNVINDAIQYQNPLLITGERYMRELVARSVAFEFNKINKEVFEHYFCRWKLRKGQKFNDSIYHFDHVAKKRDLEYHRFHPETNPVKRNEFYYTRGPIVRLFEMIETDPRMKDNPSLIMGPFQTPVLEIQDVHLADEDFLVELMAFLEDRNDIFIPELDKKIEARRRGFIPLIILTADQDFSINDNHEGVIYHHEIQFPTKNFFLRKFQLQAEEQHKSIMEYINEEAREKMKAIVELMVGIFFLSKDNAQLQRGNVSFPMTIPQLSDSIASKMKNVSWEGTELNPVIEELEKLIESLSEVGKNVKLHEALESIKKSIEDNKIREALRSFELIEKNLKKEYQIKISQLRTQHNDLTEREINGIESELILHPMRNKLTWDLLSLISEIEDA